MDEISSDGLARLESRYRTTQIIYSAQIITTIILIIVGYFVIKEAETAASTNSLTVLWAAILFFAVGTFLLRRMLYRWERLKNLTLLKGISGLLAALQTNTIILGILTQAVTVFGFVIAMINGIKGDLIRAGVVSLIVFLVNFPRKSVWEKIVTSLEKV